MGYYWLKFTKTVHLYTPSCHECLRRKNLPRNQAGLLQPIVPTTALFEQIGLGLHEPPPPSTWFDHWIIVATDYRTRYADRKALPSETVLEVTKFVVEFIVFQHGASHVLSYVLMSVAFIAQLTEEILCLSHTDHRRTTAYHLQTYGLTGRLNKVIADIISMYCVQHGGSRDHWDNTFSTGAR